MFGGCGSRRPPTSMTGWAAPSRWSGHALPRRWRRRAAFRLGPSGFDRCRGLTQRRFQTLGSGFTKNAHPRRGCAASRAGPGQGEGLATAGSENAHPARETCAPPHANRGTTLSTEKYVQRRLSDQGHSQVTTPALSPIRRNRASFPAFPSRNLFCMEQPS
jgi:hypothetical protein